MERIKNIAPFDYCPGRRVYSKVRDTPQYFRAIPNVFPTESTPDEEFEVLWDVKNL
jgi:hypothetical protein